VEERQKLEACVVDLRNQLQELQEDKEKHAVNLQHMDEKVVELERQRDIELEQASAQVRIQNDKLKQEATSSTDGKKNPSGEQVAALQLLNAKAQAALKAEAANVAAQDLEIQRLKTGKEAELNEMSRSYMAHVTSLQDNHLAPGL
jgi:hypothetical protein